MDPQDSALRQRRHYEYLQELQSLSSTLPMQVQQRLPLELLSNLASVLIDNTIFDMVTELKGIQTMTEKSLIEARNKLAQQHKAERLEKQRRHRDQLQANQAAPHRLPLIQKEIEREMNEFDQTSTLTLEKTDRRILTELDSLVTHQQATLEKAGVPGFYVTTNPQEVHVQMQLLNLLLRLAPKR